MVLNVSKIIFFQIASSRLLETLVVDFSHVHHSFCLIKVVGTVS